MRCRVSPPEGSFGGETRVPGDKSIGHRAVLFGALARGVTLVRGFPGGADVLASLRAAEALGAATQWSGTEVRIEGRGLDLGRPGETAIDCANSGTTMRLSAGIAAGHGGRVVLDGDDSLRRRPMERVAEPLRTLGAHVETTEGRPPVRVRGGALAACDIVLPTASAQVKSAALLAGLRAQGSTRVTEPMLSRDHTERLLRAMGVGIVVSGTTVTIEGGRTPEALEIPLPGDPSSAAFFAVGACLAGLGELRLLDVGWNPTRTGVFRVLERMGGVSSIDDETEVAGEPRATLVVRPGALRGTTIEPHEVPATIDELPILAIAAAFASGETRLTGAEELRVKESDRLAALEQLRRLGVAIDTTPDGFVIAGSAGAPLRPAVIEAHGDHRIAMAFAIAGLATPGGVTIAGAECVDVSFPKFFEHLARLGARVDVL